MNTKDPLFLFVLRQSADEPEPTPEQMQRNMQKWMTWIDGMRAKGIYGGGDRLQDAPAKVVRGLGKPDSDGPFIEAKEVIGGYMLISAPDIAEATEIARGCPGFENGWSVEIRALYPRQNTP